MFSPHRSLTLVAVVGLFFTACDAAPDPSSEAAMLDDDSDTLAVAPRSILPTGPLIRSCDTSYVPPAAFPPIDPVGLLSGADSACTVGTSNSPCAPHHVYSPSPIREREPLFVFLPGTNMEPEQHDHILLTAASTGYRTIGLSYDNTTNISDACVADPACGDNCSGLMREEVIRGSDESPLVDIERGDSVVVRLYRVLEHMDTIDPTGGWSDYYVPATGRVNASDILWENIILGGFSQGAGHAAMISRSKQVHGLFLVDGASDTCDDPVLGPQPADWMTTGTDASAGRPKYGVHHDHGLGLTSTTDSWQALGLGTSLANIDCSFLGCDVLDPAPPPPASVTEQLAPPDPPLIDRPFPSFACTEHRSMAHDLCMPIDVDGTAAATHPEDSRLFEVYARRMCNACDVATCP